MNNAAPKATDIVLIGGGHAHVHVLVNLALRPLPGMRVTLIARDLAMPYSGMLPGVIAGLYRAGQAHIDLARLATVTGTRLIHAQANGLDRANKRVLLAGLPPVAYDLVSIDVGIEPSLSPVDGAAEHAIAVKPIGSFLTKIDALIARAGVPDGPRRIVAIGGGAGGVELLLSLRTRLIADARAAGRAASELTFTLVTEGDILATHNDRVRAAFRRAFAERGMILLESRRVRAVTADTVVLADGEAIGADAVLATTDAAAPAWFRGTGLDLDAKGFLAVGPTLQSVNDADVFAAGDCAALIESPREKAGVYAVRAGPPLADALHRRACGLRPDAWHPQARHLALISTGERYAIASRGLFKVEGAWLWTLKDWIDRRWMRQYQDTDALARRMAAR